jgi:hypothetical protein
MKCGKCRKSGHNARTCKKKAKKRSVRKKSAKRSKKKKRAKRRNPDCPTCDCAPCECETCPTCECDPCDCSKSRYNPGVSFKRGKAIRHDRDLGKMYVNTTKRSRRRYRNPGVSFKKGRMKRHDRGLGSMYVNTTKRRRLRRNLRRRNPGSPGNFRPATIAQSKMFLDDFKREGVTSVGHLRNLDYPSAKERRLAGIRFKEAQHTWGKYQRDLADPTTPAPLMTYPTGKDFGDYMPISNDAASGYLRGFYTRQRDRLDAGLGLQSVTQYPFKPRYDEAVEMLGQSEADSMAERILGRHDYDVINFKEQKFAMPMRRRRRSNPRTRRYARGIVPVPICPSCGAKEGNKHQKPRFGTAKYCRLDSTAPKAWRDKLSKKRAASSRKGVIAAGRREAKGHLSGPVVGKMLRKSSMAGPCFNIGRITRETAQFYVIGKKRVKKSTQGLHLSKCRYCNDHPNTFYPRGYHD